MTFPSETPPVIPFVTLKAVDVESSVEPIELTVNLFTLPVILIVSIFEEVEIDLILNELLISVIMNLSVLFSSYILILFILESSLNTKVKYSGGGERVILFKSVRQSSLLIFFDSNVSIDPDVVIVPISNVLPIPEISTDDETSFGFTSLIEPITSYGEVSAVLIFDIIISSIDSSVILLIWTFPLVNPVIDGVLVIPLTVNVGVLVLSPDL